MLQAIELIKLKKGEIIEEQYQERLMDKRRKAMSVTEKQMNSGDMLGGGQDNPINERRDHASVLSTHLDLVKGKDKEVKYSMERYNKI